MKLSNVTIGLLKHAASINPGIIIDPGSDIFSMHENKTVRMQASVNEDFPKQFAIMNLNQFLNVLSLFDDPELDFKEDHVVITSDTSSQKVVYYYSDPEVIKQSNKKLKAEIDYEIEFNLSKEDLGALNKAAATIGVEDICVYSNKGSSDICVAVLNKARQAGNAFELVVGSDDSLTDKSFKIYFRKNNLKLTSNDFRVKLSTKGISTWIATDCSIPELLFHIAIEKDSQFDETE